MAFIFPVVCCCFSSQWGAAGVAPFEYERPWRLVFFPDKYIQRKHLFFSPFKVISASFLFKFVDIFFCLRWRFKWITSFDFPSSVSCCSISRGLWRGPSLFSFLFLYLPFFHPSLYYQRGHLNHWRGNSSSSFPSCYTWLVQITHKALPSIFSDLREMQTFSSIVGREQQEKGGFHWWKRLEVSLITRHSLYTRKKTNTSHSYSSAQENFIQHFCTWRHEPRDKTK